MGTSDNFKQELRAGNLTKAIKMALSEAIELKITTWVVPANFNSLDAEESKPGYRMQTRINIVDGNVENEVGSEFLSNGPYTELREFHVHQVQEGRETIRKNLEGLQRLFSIFGNVLQTDSATPTTNLELSGSRNPQLPPVSPVEAAENPEVQFTDNIPPVSPDLIDLFTPSDFEESSPSTTETQTNSTTLGSNFWATDAAEQLFSPEEAETSNFLEVAALDLTGTATSTSVPALDALDFETNFLEEPLVTEVSEPLTSASTPTALEALSLEADDLEMVSPSVQESIDLEEPEILTSAAAPTTLDTFDFETNLSEFAPSEELEPIALIDEEFQFPTIEIQEPAQTSESQELSQEAEAWSKDTFDAQPDSESVFSSDALGFSEELELPPLLSEETDQPTPATHDELNPFAAIETLDFTSADLQLPLVDAGNEAPDSVFMERSTPDQLSAIPEDIAPEAVEESLNLLFAEETTAEDLPEIPFEPELGAPVGMDEPLSGLFEEDLAAEDFSVPSVESELSAPADIDEPLSGLFEEDLTAEDFSVPSIEPELGAPTDMDEPLSALFEEDLATEDFSVPSVEPELSAPADIDEPLSGLFGEDLTAEDFSVPSVELELSPPTDIDEPLGGLFGEDLTAEDFSAPSVEPELGAPADMDEPLGGLFGEDLTAEDFSALSVEPELSAPADMDEPLGGLFGEDLAAEDFSVPSIEPELSAPTGMDEPLSGLFGEDLATEDLSMPSVEPELSTPADIEESLGGLFEENLGAEDFSAPSVEPELSTPADIEESLGGLFEENLAAEDLSALSVEPELGAPTDMDEPLGGLFGEDLAAEDFSVPSIESELSAPADIEESLGGLFEEDLATEDLSMPSVESQLSTPADMDESLSGLFEENLGAEDFSALSVEPELSAPTDIDESLGGLFEENLATEDLSVQFIEPELSTPADIDESLGGLFEGNLATEDLSMPSVEPELSARVDIDESLNELFEEESPEFSLPSTLGALTPEVEESLNALFEEEPAVETFQPPSTLGALTPEVEESLNVLFEEESTTEAVPTLFMESELAPTEAVDDSLNSLFEESLPEASSTAESASTESAINFDEPDLSVFSTTDDFTFEEAQAETPPFEEVLLEASPESNPFEVEASLVDLFTEPTLTADEAEAELLAGLDSANITPAETEPVSTNLEDSLTTLFADSNSEEPDLASGLPDIDPSLSVEESLAVLFGEPSSESAQPLLDAPTESTLDVEALAELFTEPPLPSSSSLELEDFEALALQPELEQEEISLEEVIFLEEGDLQQEAQTDPSLDQLNPFADFSLTADLHSLENMGSSTPNPDRANSESVHPNSADNNSSPKITPPPPSNNSQDFSN